MRLGGDLKLWIGGRRRGSVEGYSALFWGSLILDCLTGFDVLPSNDLDTWAEPFRQTALYSKL